ncbi:MAG TPA: prolyl oligopeptidase family serine peptidase [Cyclobacteriaceae bacterium]|nr:prolyl oligopeptidase family serine peptidase [Cyclobacteriaceae bacterium]HMW99896.1 prolyl oligopeptidase family serine peptidase [Cyclobacteriaceae bacterium]HNC29643.1 prolyl oligopeptidase family serine peptidase [Cyclobacteriaceae bacterium]HNH60869.1 prolyl oligopeptidase family serine peptidase [Cyclobacteriaceae bacterium]
MMKRFFLVLAGLCFTACCFAQKKIDLRRVLGVMPSKPALQVDTLEKVHVGAGNRYKIRYLAEPANTDFHTPPDYITAYLFIPDEAKYRKLPAIVAIHQDGSHNYLGNLEPAGIAGDPDQHYGLELFNRGYIVICPERFLHGSRRRIPKPDTLADVFEVADLAEEHRLGQLLLEGRNFAGKEVYDLMLTTDVLCTVRGVDENRIGAIGHSAGGYVLAYFMFMDKRIAAGVSSCGVFELTDWFDEDAIRKRHAMTVVPGMALVGKTSDYVGFIAPRPFLMTRGLYEWGNETGQQRQDSRRHADETLRMQREANRYYEKSGGNPVEVITFDEAGGAHAFPSKVKERVYVWLDSHLKK